MMENTSEPPQPPESPLPEKHTQPVITIPNTNAAHARRRKARRRLMVIVAVLAMAGAAVWTFQHFSSTPLRKIASLETAVTSEVQKNFVHLPPAGVTSTIPTHLTAAQAQLDAKGVIADTNKERATHGNLPALKENATLDDIATLRLDDMFKHQYFSHFSPTGESALTVASSVGYNHIALGENLAEGMFKGDQGLLDAWMASPGHRANILDTHYTEIGVAVRRGMFQGHEVWIAVQEFGKPASACPAPPDPALKAAIANAQSSSVAMATQIKTLKARIDDASPQ